MDEYLSMLSKKSWSKLDGVEVHLIQMWVEKGNREKNVKHAVEMIGKEVKSGSVGPHEVDIVGLPEFWATGCPTLYPIDWVTYRKIAEPIPDEPGASVDECPNLKKISEAAEEYGIYIQAGTQIEIDRSGNIFNAATLFDRSGKYLGKYRKVQVWIPEPGPGESFPVFETDIGNIGINICYDGNFPEISRILALKGAEIIFRPSEWNDPFSAEGLDWWKAMNVARAIENHCYIVAVSCVGITDEMVYPGHSMVVDPYGRIVVAAPDGLSERLLQCSVDVNEVRRIRQTWKTDNHIQQIRLDIYAREYAEAAARRKS